MGFEPLALRYRPRLFSDMVGQEHVTEGLRAAVEADRVAHAYLFAGPRGTGKTTTARILARCLNCEKGPTPDPCGTCAACEAIIEGTSLDVLELDAASQRKVEDTEDWVSTVHLVPAGRFKVYIVDEVHMFSKASFNLLLKTFEEPPPHVVFVLATTEPDKVPATVRGRCQRFDLRLVPHPVLVERYRYVCEREGVEPEAGALELVARQASGSVRDGLMLMDQALSDDGTRIELARVHAITGAVDRGLLTEAVDLMARRDAAGVFTLVERVVSAGCDLRRFAEDVVGYLRGVMLSAAGGDPARLLDAVDETAADDMERHGRVLGAAGAIARLTALAEVAREIDNGPLGRITLEAALVKCCLLGHAPHPEPMAIAPEPPTAAAQPDERDRPHPPVVAEVPSAPPPVAADNPPPAPADLLARWRDVEESVGKVLAALLQGCLPISLDGSHLRVGVDQKFKLTKLDQKKQELMESVSRFFGPSVVVDFEAMTVPPPAPPVEDEPEPSPQGMTEAPPPTTASVEDLVKQGFGAEVVERYTRDE